MPDHGELHAVVLAGGAGTRFWPASRAARPKHFLPLGAQGRSLLEATLVRCAALAPRERIWIATNELQARAIGDLLPSFPPTQILIEPEARDTAPAVALAAARIEARAPGAVMAMFPADHWIHPPELFVRCLEAAVEQARGSTALVTLGIVPTRAATGYGYIELGAGTAVPWIHHVAQFREKPDRATAEQFLAGGRHLWNSGIFVWTYAALRAAMGAGNRELAAATDAMLLAARAGDEPRVAQAFASAPRTSIDFAVLEHAPEVLVVRAMFEWDDLGSFLSLPRVAAPDADGNVALLAGGAGTVAEQSHGNLVYAEGPRLVALFGVEDLVVVAVGDAVLVCPKARAEELKVLVQRLQQGPGRNLL